MNVRTRGLLGLAARASLAFPPPAAAGDYRVRAASRVSHYIASHRITSHRITSHRITSHHIAIFARRDAITAAGFVPGTAAVMSLDRHIAVESQRPSLQDNAGLSHTTTIFRVLGEPCSIVLVRATYI